MFLNKTYRYGGNGGKGSVVEERNGGTVFFFV